MCIRDRLVHLCVTQSVVVSLLLMVDTSEEFFYFDFALQLHHAIHDSLWAWRTSRYEDINRDNLINSSYHMITALERTTRTVSYTHLPLADTSCPARVPQRKTVQVMSDKNINGKVITAGAS